ncbi:MAG: oligosaccharide repeat unit polymerase [Arcobacter sp.]|nr:oligosaccharide repeat unit polymerase [Flavobacteriaceae bacterium]MBD3829842.1 oligosaccharide repeat unit polymerase [Arcobacter sp.]
MIIKYYNILFFTVFLIYTTVFLFLTQKNPEFFPVSINYIAFGIFFLMTIYHSKLLVKVPKSMLMIVLIFFMFTVSVLYGPDKLMAVKQWISLFLLYYILLFIYAFLDVAYAKSILLSVLLISIVYIVLSVNFYNQNLDYQGMYIGLTGNRHNTSMIFGVFASIAIATMLLYQSKITYFIAIIAVMALQILIFLTWARIGFFVELIFLLFMIPYFLTAIRYKYLKYSFIVVGIIIATLAFFYLRQFYMIEEYINNAIERGTTGRTSIDTALFNWQAQNGWLLFALGFGIGSLEHYAYLSDLFIRDTNNITGIIFVIGMIGFLLYFLLFLQLMIILKNNIKNKESYVFASLALSIFLVPSETSWQNFNYFTTVFMYICITLAIKYDKFKGTHI